MTALHPRLRDVELSDKDRLRDWRNQPNVARWMYSDHEIGPEEHARWFVSATADPGRRYWIIEAGGRPVGLINLYDIELECRQAGFAYYLAEEPARGGGLASWAGLQVLDFAFGELGLMRVWAEALVENAASIGYLAALGFREAEVMRAHVQKAGLSGDVVRMVLHVEDWASARQACRERLTERGYDLEG